VRCTFYAFYNYDQHIIDDPQEFKTP